MSNTQPSFPYPTRPCPICDGRPGPPLFTQRFQPLPGATLIEGYDVVTCADCGCGYADGIPDQAAFDAYYRDLSKYETDSRGGQETELDQARYPLDADFLRGFIPDRSSRVLDVGCATGGLLAVLKQRGYTELTGLDPAPNCSEIARRIYDLRVIVGSLGDPPPDEPRFDFLILNAVLEHVRDLRPFLARVEKWLAPGGQVFVEVPDGSNFSAGRNAPFQEFSIEHINFFSPRSLENLMSRNGFASVQITQSQRGTGRGMVGAVVLAVFKKGTCPLGTPRDDSSGPALTDYISTCHAAEEQERRLFAELTRTGRPIIVWGVGTHTRRLLATSQLAEANITAFVDSSPKYQGKVLNGAPIIAPTELAGRTEPILIGSWLYQSEIIDQIRNELGLSNEILKLYEI